jgi:TonB family protein
VQQAQIAVRFDPLRYCPELRVADPEEQNVAIIVFSVGPTGVPSQAAVKTAASSDGLDTASRDCVLRLRFQPAIRWGDGAPIESWQQIAWKWAPARARQGAAGAAAAQVPNAGAAAGAASGSADVAVRVCVDAAGKLQRDPAIIRSSGDASFDAAALQIAKAGSGSYRAGAGAAASGCLELSIKPAGK